MNRRGTQIHIAIILTLVLLLAAAVPAPAQGVTVGANCTIAWTANSEADLAMYRVYGTLQPSSGSTIVKMLDIPKPVVAGPTVSTTCAQLGLQTGGTLTVQVDAVDVLGNRSPKSVLVTAVQDIAAPAQPTGLMITPNP